MKQLPTAEEFLRSKFKIAPNKNVYEYLIDVEIEESMVEFAKLHVEAALNAAKYMADEKEILEKAAEEWIKGFGNLSNSKQSFIEGAKWQSQRMYS